MKVAPICIINSIAVAIPHMRDPNCGGMKRSQWVEDRMGELLPTTYFHLVFTLPQELRSLCMGNRKLLFGLLFKAAQHTILTLSKDEKYIGGTPGIVSILHTHVQRTPMEGKTSAFTHTSTIL